MLESFVAWVLNNYVGEYFRLNTDQLSIALLQGQVDLENVPLRATALSKFDIPVQVKCGVIGSLQLCIPLAHIRSQPWTLRLRDCLALLGPTTAVSQCHDVQTVDKWQQQKRERWLDELETVHKKKLLEQLGIDSAEDTAEQDSWWGASLLSSISNNIQVILENAHIRYECPTYSYGVKIQSLTIQTTNSNWRPGFVPSAEGVNIFKKIDISGFSIYWNPTDDSQQQGDRVRLVPSYEMLREELGSPLATCASADQFILLPFSLEVRIEQNSSRFPLLRTVPSTPRFKLDIRSQRIELELNRRQIAQIQSLAYEWAQFDRARPHRKWRPLVSVHESPKQWWRFAISRTLDEVRARWPFFPRATVLTRVRLVNGYARAYRRRLKLCIELHREEADGKNDHLSCSPPPISHEDIALIKQIEHGSEFTYNVLYSLREAVFQQMMLKSNIKSHLPRSHNESPFEIIKSTKSPPIAHQMSTKGPAPRTGWYGWITNWFTEEANGSDAQKEIKNGGQDANEALYLSMKPPKLTKHKLDPELEAVESRMEAEILQMLNESWDESTILRRDNLLAEIVLNVAKVFFRFSEEKEDEARREEEKPSSSPSLSDSTTPTSVEASSSAFDIQLLTFDLSRLCSRIHLSPKEHRTEVSLSVADLTVQRVKQQTTTASPSAENSEVSASVGDKKNTVGSIPLISDGLQSGSDEFDESLIYGFQQKNAQSTQLLLAIGRTYDVNLKEKANERQKRNERRFNFDQKSRPSDAVHSPCSPSSSTFASGQTPKNEEKGHRRVEEDNNAILRLFYKRLAPKLEVYHELNISCAPLSIICDECALNGIFEPFTQKVQQRFVQKQQTHVKEQYEFASSSTDTVTHQLFASVAIPELAIELRSKKAAQDYLLSPKIGQVVPSTSSNLNESDAHLRSVTSSFARGNVRSLFMTFSRRDFQRLSKLELDFDDVLLEDVFQGCPEEFPLFNIINDQTDPVELEHQSKCSSRSCPDLTVCMDSNDVVRLIGVDKTPKVEKHLEHQLQMPLDATAIVDQLLGTSLPPLSSLEAISISNANDSNKSANSSESLRMSSPEGAAREQNRRRKTMMGTATPKRAIHRRHSLCFVFIDGNSNVEAYNPPYNCQISGHFKDAEIELGLNRRTWILLMDFFGLLNSHNCASKMLQTPSKYQVKCELAARRVHLAMNYSEIGKRLGLCVLDGPKLTVQTDVNIVDEPIQIWLIADALRVTDSVPFCSSLYTERLVIQNSDDDTSFQRPPIRINVLKYRTRDSQCSLREFDMSLTAEVNGNVNYLHTQRFFYAFMDFWLQLAELYEKILFSNFSIKQTDNEQEALADDLVSSFKTRCKVDLRVSGGDINLFVPLSQCSPHAIVVECCSLHAQNNFCYSSSLRDLITKHLINNQCQSAHLLSADADCLLDAMSITLCNLRIGHGIFVPKNGLKDKRKRMERNGIVKCFDAFDGMALFLKADQQIVMDKSDFSLTVDIYRNLSASNSFPNLFVLFRLQDVSFCFTTDFYKLLRGCLDYNFGEVIIPQPETIPVELLEMPEEIDVVLGDKHLVFTLRIVLKKVQLHLLTPISSFCPDVFEKFALLYIRSAKLFYDCFMDAKSEFDFICGGATLEDARADKKADNVFRKIVQPICGLREQRATHSESKDSLKSVGSQSDGQKKKPLLFESHIIMRRDEPPIISLVLAKARVILLMDWIETLKAFILLNADSILPTADGHASFRNVSSSLSNVDLSKSGVLIRSTGSPRFVLPHQKPSVLFPFSSSDNQNTTTEQQMSSSKFVLKVTLKECDLVALEDARRRDTFALIAHTTAAIIVNNLTDTDQIGSQYEIKQLCFYWCVMDSQTDTWTQLTNETTATATIEYERPPLSSSNCASSSERDGASAADCEPQKKYQKCSAVGPASSLVVRPQAKSLEHLLSSTNHQVISVELGTLVIRGLLKDFFIVKCVMDKYIEVWSRFREESIQFWSKRDPLPTTISRHYPLFPTEISAGKKAQKAKTSTTTKFLVKSDNLCVWILEEGNKINTTPFLRFNIRDLRIKSALGKVRTDLNLSIDYYRLRTLPGWEPLLEQCNKIGVDVNFTDINRLSILLKSSIGGPIEVTLTQLFIERALDFVAHWNSIRQILLDSEQAQGLDQLRHLFHQQRKNAPGKEVQLKCSAVPSPSSSSHKNDEHPRATLSHSAKKTHFTVYDHHRPYDTVADSALTSAVDVQLELDDGLGISLVAIVDEDVEQDGQKQEELCYGRLSGIKLNGTKSKATYRINCHVSSIQIDNQIIGADRWHFLFCDPNALKDEPVAGLPALSFEMSFTSTEFFDVYECFRLKLSNACILLDEQLLWRLVHFVQCVLKRSQDQGDHSQQHQQQQQPEFGAAATASGEGSEHGRDSSSFLNSNCYFGTLQLEFGNISLSVLTVDKSSLSPSIRQLKDSYSDQIILFSFENALVTLAPFCSLRCFCAVDRLFDTLGNFYLEELKRQKLNIIFAMDAFGNPMALGNELKEGFQGLIFEGDLAGFAFGLGYGAANSISKVTSSMAQGVGSLTFDEKHEELRRRMRRAKPEQSGPLTHLYGGIKGLGVGVFGGLTAIVKNTITATQEEGLLSGIARGVATGAIDTVTKPLQGTLDLLEGTASAVKEIVGAPLVRRAHFPDHRLRPSRVCSSLSGLLPAFSVEMAEAQLELMRITGTYSLNDENRLLAVVPFLMRTNHDGARVVQRALISLVQCCIVRQVDSHPSMVTYCILFQHLNTVQLVSNDKQQQQHNNSKGGRTSARATTQQQRLALIEFVCNSADPHKHSTHASSSSAHLSQQQLINQSSSYYPQSHQTLTLWCSDRETAKHLCKQIMRAKALFDRRGPTGGKVLQRNAKKLLPIFTI